MTAKINDLYRVYSYPDKPANKLSGLCCVNIRVADRKDRNKNINIPIYLPTGERLKIRPDQFEKGRFIKMPESKANQYQDLTDTMILSLKKITANNVFTKSTLENSIYGSEFLNKHK